MARDKSAVLSTADKKAVITDIKTRLKESKDGVKSGNATVKTLTKEYEAGIKAVTKAHQIALKDVNKVVADAEKAVAKLEAELSAITQA